VKIRRIIKEIVAKTIFEQDVLGQDITNTINDISTQLSSDLENIDAIVKNQKIDLTNSNSEIKSKNQLKNKLSANSPEKKGLEREVPEAEKNLKNKEKQLKDLEKAKQGIIKAKSEIEKQRQEIEKQAKLSKNVDTKNISSVLPPLQSPI
jgi:DNA repair exonuclease SbcCD ATPase subunit